MNKRQIVDLIEKRKISEGIKILLIVEQCNRQKRQQERRQRNETDGFGSKIEPRGESQGRYHGRNHREIFYPAIGEKFSDGRVTLFNNRCLVLLEVFRYGSLSELQYRNGQQVQLADNFLTIYMCMCVPVCMRVRVLD